MSKDHWENIYQTHLPSELSWYSRNLSKSLELIQSLPGVNSKTPILDVGAGASSLCSDLLERGYLDVTALDLSRTALTKASQDSRLKWIVADITEIITLEPQHYAVWHDRAVFHFLIHDSERDAYRQRLLNALRPDGYVVISTFGPEGSLRCSGLEVQRYSAKTLSEELGPRFQLVRNSTEQHMTPAGKEQQFIFCVFRLAG
jgi:2-polyprenyl-3-methyl-5-hydroxy-6-metoxy-1,4-benzoquinol methylase